MAAQPALQAQAVSIGNCILFLINIGSNPQISLSLSLRSVEIKISGEKLGFQ